MYNVNDFDFKDIKNEELKNAMLELFNIDISSFNATWQKAVIYQQIENGLLYAEDFHDKDGEPSMRAFCNKIGIPRTTFTTYVQGANFVDAKKIDISKTMLSPNTCYYLSRIENYDQLIKDGTLSLTQLATLTERRAVAQIKKLYLAKPREEVKTIRFKVNSISYEMPITTLERYKVK